MTKEFTNDPVKPGETVTLEFTLTHPEDAINAATDIFFTDDLAPVLTGLTANLPSSPDPPCGVGSSLTGSAGDTKLTLMGGSLQPGESCTFSVDLNVPAGAALGSHTNTTSSVSATVGGLATTSQAASDDLKISNLVFTKEFIGNPVIAGETTMLRFNIENKSATDAVSTIHFFDDLDRALSNLAATDASSVIINDATCGAGATLIGTTNLTFAGAEVPPSTTCSFDVEVLVPINAADGNYTNTTSSLLATQSGSNIITNPATANLNVNSTLLSLSKEFVGDPLLPGSTGTLRFTLSNLDPDQAASAIAFKDVLGDALSGMTVTGLPLTVCGGMVTANPDAGTIDFSGGSLSAGGSCMFEVSVNIPGDAAANTYTNTTTAVSGTIGGFAVKGNAASDNFIIIDKEASFTKSFDGPTTAGGTTMLTFTLTNTGSSSLTDLQFNDNLDAVLSGLAATNLPMSDVCGEGSILSGTSFLTLTGASLPTTGNCSFTVDLAVPSNATAGTYTNQTSKLSTNGLEVADTARANLIIEPAPIFTKVFAADSIGLNLNSTLTFTIDNSASSLNASSLNFTDNLPAGVVVATPSGGTTNCTNGTLTAVDGSSTITYTGGTVMAGASCTVTLDVTGTTVGTHTNTSEDLTSSSGNSGTATDDLTVNPQPGFAKNFVPNPILIGGVSTLTFTIDNSASSVDATSLAFTDNLPTGVIISTPNAATTTCLDGTITAVNGTGIITYTGGRASKGTSCTISVDVTSSTAGSHVNTTGDLTSNLGNSGTAVATLVVIPPPSFTKSFSPNTIIINTDSKLTFTIDNTASPFAATALDFTDILPAGIVISYSSNTTNTCTGGTLTAVGGTNTISYTGGTIAASTSCAIMLDVTGTTVGTKINTSGDLTSSLGNSGTASANLIVQSDTDGDGVSDAADLCPIGDDNINTDGLGMPDACDCDPDDPNDEFIRKDDSFILPGTYRSSFQLNSSGTVAGGINATFVAGNNIVLEPGFSATASGGSFFHAFIQRCDEISVLQDEPIIEQLRLSSTPVPLEAPKLAIIPNPFSNYTNIEYDLPTSGKVVLQVYYQTGQLIKTIHQNQFHESGHHQIQINTSEYPKGLYLFNLWVNGRMVTRRGILSK